MSIQCICVWDKIHVCTFARNMQNFHFFARNVPAPHQVSQSPLKPLHTAFWCFGQKYVSIFAQYGPAPDQVWQSHLEPPHSIFRCFGQKYASYCEICKILISTENRPSPVVRITESPKTFRLVISLFQIKIYKFMRDRQNFHFPLKTAQFCFLVLYVNFNLSIDYFSVPDKNWSWYLAWAWAWHETLVSSTL